MPTTRVSLSVARTNNQLCIFVDTDFAGCRITRRSTSGGVAFIRSHCLRHWSSTQARIALSSGEAELGGLCKGATHGLGLRSMANDIGIEMAIHLKSDATAAIGMSRRLGVGRVRQLVHKVLGSENCADIIAKHVERSLLGRHVAGMGLSMDTSRPSSAPKLVYSCVQRFCPDLS